jgi:hypothetical protein
MKENSGMTKIKKAEKNKIRIEIKICKMEFF